MASPKKTFLIIFFQKTFLFLMKLCRQLKTSINKNCSLWPRAYHSSGLKGTLNVGIFRKKSTLMRQASPFVLLVSSLFYIKPPTSAFTLSENNPILAVNNYTADLSLVLVSATS